jgi:hypothetical protein
LIWPKRLDLRESSSADDCATDRQCRDRAWLAVVQERHILVEPAGPAAGNNVGSDLSQFKGIFMRNLALLASSVDQATAAPYVAFIRDNVRSILASNRNSINQFGYAWSGPSQTRRGKPRP